MNLEPNNKSLSFAEFLDAAIRDKAEAKPFPYTFAFTVWMPLRSRKNERNTRKRRKGR